MKEAEQERKRRRIEEKGRCGPDCNNVRGECKFHPLEGQRCGSCLDKKPGQQCSLSKAADSHYCDFHQPFPNLGKYVLQYALEHGANVQVEDFLQAYYPDATETPAVDLNNLAAALLNTSSSSNNTS